MQHFSIFGELGDKTLEFIVDTDEALCFDKTNNTITHYNSNRQVLKQSVLPFTMTPLIKTGTMPACLAVHVETEDKIFILHVSPSQASNDGCSIKPYNHLSMLDPGSRIYVMVVGHTDNFDEAIFHCSISEKMLEVKNLIVEGNLESILSGTFNLKDKTVKITQLHLKKDNSYIIPSYDFNQEEEQKDNNIEPDIWL